MSDEEPEGTTDDGKPDYRVGYCRPPREYQFRPGQSGNRKGRPKEAVGLKSELEAALSERVTVNENGRTRKISKLRLALIQLANKAAKGDPKATATLIELMIRLFGTGDDTHSEGEALAADDAELLADFLNRKTRRRTSGDGRDDPESGAGDTDAAPDGDGHA